MDSLSLSMFQTQVVLVISSKLMGVIILAASLNSASAGILLQTTLTEVHRFITISSPTQILSVCIVYFINRNVHLQEKIFYLHLAPNMYLLSNIH